MYGCTTVSKGVQYGIFQTHSFTQGFTSLTQLDDRVIAPAKFRDVWHAYNIPARDVTRRHFLETHVHMITCSLLLLHDIF